MSREEGNKLIAEFMGLEMEILDLVHYPQGKHEWQVSLLPNIKPFNVYGSEEDAIQKMNLKYDSSWDWLMPSWQKFRDMRLSETDEGLNDDYSRHLQAIGTAITHYPIEIACERLVRGIEWYNSQEKLKP